MQIQTERVPESKGTQEHTRIVSVSESHTIQAARLLAATTTDDTVILLNGDLGAGKSLFARAFMNALQSKDDDEISGESPTFSLVNQYHTTRGTVTHFDLYRLESSEEVMHIGLEDVLAEPGILLIEWPELALPFLHYVEDITHVFIETSSAQHERVIRIMPPLPLSD